MQLGRPVATGVVVERVTRVEEERERNVVASEPKEVRGSDGRAPAVPAVEVPPVVAGR
ncbi:hypothetical protein OG948_27985 [Embleya sp. NBC_00888]|uniref:hypothetical protein n=1 Tax=Embleya sp. NBC_00888 TaxID=2975960 RepID=UPI00386738A4|nr:hypothetical protein OG948_27985 [Embleya sp. NBC_00888]